MAFHTGQICVGLRHSYRMLEPAHRRTTSVWLAHSISEELGKLPDKVVIKTASQLLLDLEAKHLTKLQGHSRIRQLLDRIVSPPSIVLEWVDEELRTVSLQRRLRIPEIQIIARQLLEALSFAHSKNLVHTDIKPHNILLAGFKADQTNDEAIVKLADWANASEPSDHLIQPRAFRSPESWLGLPWGSAADIWSVGAVIGSLLLGPHKELFDSQADNDQDADIETLHKQNRVTGPYPPELLSRASEDWQNIFKIYADVDEEHQPLTWHEITDCLKIPDDARSFIERVLTIDPLERPTADEVLKDKWLNQ